MSELKPCPFCGGRAEVRHGHLYVNEAVKVRCTKCFASTDFVLVDHPSIDGKTGKLKEETRYTPYMAKRKAIDAWNRRVKGVEIDPVKGEGEKDG